jgi:hypothetical protein
MTKRLRILAVALVVLVLYASGETVNIAWDAPSGEAPDAYDVQVVRDTGETSTYSTTGTTYSISQRGAGRYTVRVRSVSSVHGTSSWCESTNESCSQLTTGQAGAWKLQWNPSAPGPIRDTP